MTNPFLRRVLLLDAAATFATGALMIVAAGPAGEGLGLSRGLVLAAGVGMLPAAAAVWWLATRPVPPRGLVMALAALNVLFLLDAVLVVALGWLPSAGGVAAVLAFGAACGVLGAAEAAALRAPAAWPA